MKASLIIVSIFISNTVAEICDYENSVELTNRKYNGVTYGEGEYFVYNKTKAERGCLCMKKTCIRKCCPFGQAYDVKTKGCVNFTLEFDPPVRKGSKVIPGLNITQEFNVLINRMTCPIEKSEFRIGVGAATPDYHLKTDGKLYVTIEDNIPSTIVYSPNKYCVDNFLYEDEDKNKSVKFDGLMCFKAERKDNNMTLNAICFLISCFFIILTVAVYTTLPELRNLHGMIMVAYLLSFFVGFLFLGIMDILLIKNQINQTSCVGMTFVIYFAWLAAFFWLNVMCYDLFSKFRARNMVHGFKESNLVRFLKYCAYAFGVPTVLTILVAVLEFSHLPDSKLLPRLRIQGCFINGLSKLIYLYVPIICIWASNLVLFGLIAKKIGETEKQTKMLNKKDSQRLWLYIKLFIVTGPNWIFEVISALYPNIPYLWQFTDAYNMLVGFIIFVIFVWKKKIWLSLKNKFGLS